MAVPITRGEHAHARSPQQFVHLRCPSRAFRMKLKSAIELILLAVHIGPDAGDGLERGDDFARAEHGAGQAGRLPQRRRHPRPPGAEKARPRMPLRLPHQTQ